MEQEPALKAKDETMKDLLVETVRRTSVFSRPTEINRYPSIRPDTRAAITVFLDELDKRDKEIQSLKDQIWKLTNKDVAI